MSTVLLTIDDVPAEYRVLAEPHLWIISRCKGKRMRHGSSDADYITTRKGMSAFEGGTLRPLKNLEEILRAEKVDKLWIVGPQDDDGRDVVITVAQTAFDASALSIETHVSIHGDLGKALMRSAGERLDYAGIKLEGAIVRTHG